MATDFKAYINAKTRRLNTSWVSPSKEIKACFVLLCKICTNEKVCYPVDLENFPELSDFNAFLHVNCIQERKYQGFGVTPPIPYLLGKPRKVVKLFVRQFAGFCK